MILRPAAPDDAAGWAAVSAAATPYLLATEAAVRHDMSSRTATRVVAGADGVLVGIVRVKRSGERLGLQLQVAPEARRRGIGTALLAAVEGVLADEPVVSAIVSGDPGSLAAATAWCFELGRSHRISAVDPRTVPPAGAYADVVPLSSVDPRAAWGCVAATAGDDPSGLSRAAPYDEFLVSDWGDPVHDPGLGRAIVDGSGAVLALAMVGVAGDRAWNRFTGTRPDSRGSGLARRVKHASLVALAAAGVTRCATGNDAANVPMLAVNDALGYAPFATTYDAPRRR